MDRGGGFFRMGSVGVGWGVVGRWVGWGAVCPWVGGSVGRMGCCGSVGRWVGWGAVGRWVGGSGGVLWVGGLVGRRVGLGGLGWLGDVRGWVDKCFGGENGGFCEIFGCGGTRTEDFAVVSKGFEWSGWIARGGGNAKNAAFARKSKGIAMRIDGK